MKYRNPIISRYAQRDLDEMGKWPDGGNIPRVRYIDPYAWPYATNRIDPDDYSDGKERCWKCNRLLMNREVWNNKSKLCNECAKEALRLALSSALSVYYFLIATIVFSLGTSQFVIGLTTAVVIGTLILLGVVILGVLLYVVLYASIVVYAIVLGFFSWTTAIGRFLSGWYTAIVGRIRANAQQKRQQEHEESVQRAKEAEPKLLTGAEIDALLTEKHKERMGWK